MRLTLRSKQKQKKAGKAAPVAAAPKAKPVTPAGWTPQPDAFDSPVGESIFVRRPWAMKSARGKPSR